MEGSARPTKQQRTASGSLAVPSTGGCPCCAWRGTGLGDNAQRVKIAQQPPPVRGEQFGEFFVLRGAHTVFTMDNLGPDGQIEGDPPQLDVWVGGGKILALTRPGDNRTCGNVPGLKEIDVTGLTIVPGFVDCHVHVTGGGGEAGFASRTPEAQQGDLINGGVTTFVAVLGTDTITRSSENLLAKTRGLASCGLHGYVWAGGYQFPPMNDLTGSVVRDLVLIPEVIGVGELALSDHRSSHPSVSQLTKLAADVRVAGLLSGKTGKCYFHMGDHETALKPLVDIIDTSAVPIDALVPTHMERTSQLVDAAADWLSRGGYADFSGWPEKQRPAVKRFVSDGVPMLDQLSISSDSYGSIPEFVNGKLVSYDYGRPDVLIRTFFDMVLEDNIPVPLALSLFTRNPATMLGMKDKYGTGTIRVGGVADLLVLNLDPDLDLDKSHYLHFVVANGKVLKCPSSDVSAPKPSTAEHWVARGMFEKKTA